MKVKQKCSFSIVQRTAQNCCWGHASSRESGQEHQPHAPPWWPPAPKPLSPLTNFFPAESLFPFGCPCLPGALPFILPPSFDAVPLWFCPSFLLPLCKTVSLLSNISQNFPPLSLFQPIWRGSQYVLQYYFPWKQIWVTYPKFKKQLNSVFSLYFITNCFALIYNQATNISRILTMCYSMRLTLLRISYFSGFLFAYFN